MINRKIYKHLEDFYKTDKKALLVTGARPVEAFTLKCAPVLALLSGLDYW